MAQKDSFHPKKVVVPGYLIDEYVLVEDPATEHKQTPSELFSPVFAGNIRTPKVSIKQIPLDIRKIIGRRAVQELEKKAVVNLGIGIPGDVIGNIATEEGMGQDIVLTLESGIVGGTAVGKNEFGVARNADAIIEHEYLFDYYHGTGIDITFMGAAEVDQFGNVNVSKFNGRAIGCGGFIDDGRLEILQEGKVSKFIDQVQQITFSGVYASNHSKNVMYVTERAVFILTKDGLELTEIAPGIDLQRDILDLMSFKPIISNKCVYYSIARHYYSINSYSYCHHCIAANTCMETTASILMFPVLLNPTKVR